MRKPLPVLLGGLQLSARSCIPRRSHPAARARGAVALEPRRPGIHCALRSSRDRTHSRESSRDGVRHQPRVPASGRSHTVDRPGAEGERRANDHHRARNRIRSSSPCDQQDGDERRNPRSRRSDLRERHREPEALLHDRPPHRDRRRPGGHSGSHPADPRAHAEVRALQRTGRTHCRQREPADPEARHGLPMDSRWRIRR